MTKVPSDSRLRSAISQRFVNNEIATKHFSDLLSEYIVSGLNPPHLVAEIETGDEGKLWSNIWEAILYRHLSDAGYTLRNVIRSSAQHGPDFCVEHDGRTIWIDAIVPSPDGIPAEWLDASPLRNGEVRVRKQPDIERVLRCTSAVTAKQIKFAIDREKGIVGPDDSTVIALNICRLSDHDIDGTGISQLPLSMEAVFPIGPLGVPISIDGSQPPPAQNIPRFTVTKANGRQVKTSSFLDPAFANVSAVVQAHQKDVFEKPLILQTIHNPLATNKLPTKLFKARKEFVAVPDGEEYRVVDIAVRDVVAGVETGEISAEDNSSP